MSDFKSQYKTCGVYSFLSVTMTDRIAERGEGEKERERERLESAFSVENVDNSIRNQLRETVKSINNCKRPSSHFFFF